MFGIHRDWIGRIWIRKWSVGVQFAAWRLKMDQQGVGSAGLWASRWWYILLGTAVIRAV